MAKTRTQLQQPVVTKSSILIRPASHTSEAVDSASIYSDASGKCASVITPAGADVNAENVLEGIIQPYLEGLPPIEPSPRERLLQKIQSGKLDEQREVVDSVQQLQDQLAKVQRERDEAKNMLDVVRRVANGET